MFGNFSVSEFTLSPLCINRSQTQIKQPWQRSYQLQIMVLLNLLHYKETRSVLNIHDSPGCLETCCKSNILTTLCFDTHNLISIHLTLTIVGFLTVFVFFILTNRMKMGKTYYLLSFKRSPTYLTTRRRNISFQ